MMLNPNPLADPNTQRALEQLVFVVSDVEQRLNLVKAALAQTFAQPSFPTTGIPQDPRITGSISPFTTLGVPPGFGFGIPPGTSPAVSPASPWLFHGIPIVGVPNVPLGVSAPVQAPFNFFAPPLTFR